MEQLRQKP